MTRMRTSSTPLLAFYMLVVLLAGAVVLAAAGAAHAADATLVPVAPAEDAKLPYDIPLQPWLVPAVLDLETEFVDGLSAEFNGIAGSQTGEDLTVLVEAGTELRATTARVREAMDAIGGLDVTFGIEGIARMIPAESAFRDTFFGFVVWHEFSSAPARGMMKRFEELVNDVTVGGEGTADLAAELATAQEDLKQAIEEGNSDRIAELTPAIIDVSTRIDAVCGSVAAGALDLGVLIDSLGVDSSELLADKWAEASRVTAAVSESAQLTGPALESMSGVLHLLTELGGLREVALSSTDALSAAPGADGNLYIPWTMMRDDWELARSVEQLIIEEPPAHAAEGEQGDDHAGEEDEYVGGYAIEETRANLDALLVHLVRANEILAERAVEHTSTLVAEAAITVEEFYLDREEYSDDLRSRRKAKVFELVGKAMRENMDLVSAKKSARAARAALASARKHDVRGAGSEVDALYNYHNAWLHSLNAGAAAQRSTRVIPSKK